jgi:hypothetical protein
MGIASRQITTLAISIGLLALCGCTQTSNVTTASGIRCQTTVHNYLVSASTSSQCWDKNGAPISDSQITGSAND